MGAFDFIGKALKPVGHAFDAVITNPIENITGGIGDSFSGVGTGIASLGSGLGSGLSGLGTGVGAGISAFGSTAGNIVNSPILFIAIGVAGFLLISKMT